MSKPGELIKALADLSSSANAGLSALTGALALPFDAARAQYAKAVRVGLIENSILAARDHALMLGALEKAALGPWARHV